MTGRQAPPVLAALGSMLPLPVATALMRGIATAAERAGCTDITIGGDLQIHGTLPKPGTRAETHFIEIGPSPFHAGMLSWACSCCEGANSSFGDLGRAAADAVEHVPDGERWAIEPADKLIGGLAPVVTAPNPCKESDRG